MQNKLIPTPGQTVGPFFAFGTDFEKKHELVHPHSAGAIVLKGRVLDGAGAGIPDSMVEIWQADSDGSISKARGVLNRDGHTFTGFGRAFTNDDGEFQFWTKVPGSVNGEAPFFAVIVYARGLPNKLHTRIYLPGTDEDKLLSSLSSVEKETLVAKQLENGYLEHTIRLQSATEHSQMETVFLEF